MKFQDLAGDNQIKSKAVAVILDLFEARTSEVDSDGLPLDECLVSLYKFANWAMLYNPETRRRLENLRIQLKVFQRNFGKDVSELGALLPTSFGFTEKTAELSSLLQEQAEFVASLEIEMPKKRNPRDKDIEAHKYWLALMCNSVLMEFGVPGTSGRAGSVAKLGHAIYTLITGKTDLNLDRAAAAAINGQKTFDLLPKIASFADRRGLTKALSEAYGEPVSLF